MIDTLFNHTLRLYGGSIDIDPFSIINTGQMGNIIISERCDEEFSIGVGGFIPNEVFIK